MDDKKTVRLEPRWNLTDGHRMGLRRLMRRSRGKTPTRQLFDEGELADDRGNPVKGGEMG